MSDMDERLKRVAKAFETEPTKDAREWWIDKEIGTNHALLFEPGSISEGRGIHVIEFAALEKMRAERDECLDKVGKYASVLNGAALERDNLQAALEVAELKIKFGMENAKASQAALDAKELTIKQGKQLTDADSKRIFELERELAATEACVGRWQGEYAKEADRSAKLVAALERIEMQNLDGLIECPRIAREALE